MRPVNSRRISETGIRPAALNSSKNDRSVNRVAELLRAFRDQFIDQMLSRDVAGAVARLPEVELLLEAKQVEIRTHPAARRPLHLEGLGLP